MLLTFFKNSIYFLNLNSISKESIKFKALKMLAVLRVVLVLCRQALSLVRELP